ncbi:MAG: hypothetical protein WCV50_04165 [Patescibacteria group bacterium]
MAKKLIIFVSVFLLAIALSACAKKSANTNSFNAAEIVSGAADIKIKQQADKDLAVAKAKEQWRVNFQLGEDLSNGPCLADIIITDWSADIAHNPRQAVDDEPANQCAAYRSGKTHHFVELDPAGNLIKAQ